MTPQQIQLVRESWKSAAPARSAVADAFYDRLFEVAPGLQRLFLGDLERQKEKLMTMIGAAIAGLLRMELLKPTLEELGRRHRGFGAEPEHFDTVGACLLFALDTVLGERFTPEVRDAWAAFYRLMADAMIEGARRARAA